jgi:AcrR family transcriptional regulator
MEASNTAGNGNNGLTRDRILDEAEALFARRGYHAVSIREITQAAQCNLAAVNYHFGNKQNLYIEVFRSRWLPKADSIHKCFRDYLDASGRISPATVVASLAQAFLDGPLTVEERLRHHQLISGELAQPTKALRLVADQVLQPLFNDLMDELQSAIAADITDEALVLDAFSVLALILYFSLARPLIARITETVSDEKLTDCLVDHIVRFSLNGLGTNKREVIS